MLQLPEGRNLPQKAGRLVAHHSTSQVSTRGEDAKNGERPRRNGAHIWMGRFVGVLGAAFLSAGASFISQFILLHKLSVVDYGTIITILSIANFLQPIANLGTPTFISQIGSSDYDAPASSWIWAGLPYLTLSCAACCGFAILYWLHAGAAPALGVEELAFLVPLVLVFPIVELWAARFQVERRFLTFSALQISIQAPRLAALLATLHFHARLTLHSVLLVYSVLASVMCVAGIGGLGAWCASRGTGPRPKGWELVRQGLPYTTLALLSAGLAQLSVVLLYTLGSPGLAAQVSAAGLLIVAVGLVPSVMYTQFLLPWVAVWSRTDRRRHAAVLYVGLAGMTLAGAGFAALIIGMRTFIVFHLFGPQYAAVGGIVAVWALALPFRFGSFALSAVLLLRSNMHQKLTVHAISGGIFLIMFAALIHPLGALAAAISTIVSEIILLALHVRAAQKAVPELDWGLMRRPAFLRQQLNLVFGGISDAPIPRSI